MRSNKLPEHGVTTTILAIFASIFLLGSGSALQNTAVVLRGSLEGFPDSTIGIISAAYYAGMLGGSFLAILVIKHAGYVRSFAAFASLASVSSLAHVLLIDPLAWILLRTLHGLCLSIIFVVVESWLNVAAPQALRGRILSAYGIVYLSSMGLIQPLIGYFPPSGFELFGITSILVSLCLLPVTLTTVQGEALITDTKIRLLGVLKKSPMGTAGVITSGLVAGAHVSLAPRYAQGMGLGEGTIGLFLLVFSLGTMAMQWPLGLLSDRSGRRAALLASSLAGTAAALGLGIVPGPGPLLTGAAFLFGGFAIPLYSLSIATVNDQLLPEDMVQSASALYVFYGLGSVAGPLIASLGMERLGGPALYWIIALILAGYAVFGLSRVHRVPGFIIRGSSESYHTYPRTSPLTLQFLRRPPRKRRNTPESSPEAEKPPKSPRKTRS
ncbi:hypothetical protein AU468_07755 [Alkalispirochaeta sphaeroplastigenens]|uniref:Major facilitator superfamily (MFS) profile domain-containing protein n=1 Tax=Alkalispirochaeta sphaeroplastigenens TaxID=1187066 RepID=A0A2S4JQ09_9SPIO|nr:MFS transporter [Alkalispirochaeta sphaeroplastigenens]POR01627.1 hypothetical protein AU468_07755 [Alkalispirochaeta sphaeroplastigenens]